MNTIAEYAIETESANKLAAIDTGTTANHSDSRMGSIQHITMPNINIIELNSYG